MLIRKLSRIILAICLLSIAFYVGRHSQAITFGNTSNYGINLDFLTDSSSKGQSDELINEVYDELKQKYLNSDAMDKDKLLYGAISGMVKAVGDPYTSFFNPDEFSTINDELNQIYEGVGAVVGYRDEHIVIVAPLKGSPAEKIGIKAGDQILKVDDQEVAQMAVPEVVNLLRGKADTTVSITIWRVESEQETTFQIQRAQIEIDTVVLDAQSSVPVVQIYRFAKNTNEEWDRAVDQILEKGTPKSIIIDLRDNPGGYLESAKHIASEFLDKGQIVLKEKAKNDKSTTVFSKRTGKLKGVQIFILINNGSASSSEILAGALREQADAQLIGQTSFGKGTVQEPIKLSNGSGLHVTIAEWLLPSGQSVTNSGLVPDIEVTNSKDQTQDKPLQKALDLAND